MNRQSRVVPSRKLALVTGTSSGIGESVARELVSRSWRVVGISRREAPIDHPAYQHLSFDLADLAGLTGRISGLIRPLLSDSTLTRLALVNNAADLALLGPVDRIDPTAMLRAFAVNVVAPTWLMGLMVRNASANVPLRIVNVTSGAGVRPIPGLGTYGSTKAALRMSGQVMASELERDAARGGIRHDVTILSYSPGPVDTPMQAAARSTPREIFPLVETFVGYATDGILLAPEVPAREIAAYLEGDGHPHFLECRSGELPTRGASRSRDWRGTA